TVATWTGDATRLSICFSADTCITCTPPPPASAVRSLTDACSAAVHCTASGMKATDGHLRRSSDGTCKLGSIAFDGDGTAAIPDGPSATWTADSDKLSICPDSGDECILCTSS